MTDDLNAELARRLDDEQRMATALVELERRPGHVLLAGITPTGLTAQQWAVASDALARLWQDFAIYRGVLAAARDEAEPAALHRLLREPSVEVGRTVVERRLTGDVERVETLTLEQLSARMEAAFRVVDEVVEACGALHGAFLTGLAPLAERLGAARALAAELGAGVGELAVLTAKVDDLDRTCAADPLSLAGQPPAEVLAALAAEIAEVSARLGAIAAVRDGWDATVAGLEAALGMLADLGEQERQARALAAERIAGPPLTAPPDRLPALRQRLATLSGPVGWPARAAGLDALHRAVDEAERELRAAHALAAGLLERRAELRGRFESFRAKATRLGHAEEPDLLRIDGDVRRLLWSRPCDLAAATRALLDYQRLLQQVAGQGRTA
ncbi:hypothetical protein [Pseudonocardia kunmingensis]|nr:hypothetical protein [Pseudonocardia kunmingensis]